MVKSTMTETVPSCGVVCRQQQQQASDDAADAAAVDAGSLQFRVSSLLHAGRHEYTNQADFQLPYDISWLRQHAPASLVYNCH